MATRSTERKPPTREELIKALEESGYPFELRMALVAERCAFEVTPSWTWQDKEGGTREIDLVCEHEVCSTSFTLKLHVLVECKSFRFGTVAFCLDGKPPVPELSLPDKLGELHFWGQPPAVLNRPGAVGGRPFLTRYSWGERLWAPIADVARQYAIVRQPKQNQNHKRDQNESHKQKWSVSQEGAHETLDGLVGALRAHRERAGLVAAGYPSAYINLGVLVLAVDGPLHRYAIGRDGTRRRLAKTNTATLLRLTSPGVVARIDIVQSKALPAYLGRLLRDAEQLSRALARESALLAESVNAFGNTDERRGPRVSS